jgi:hypothetical protein
MAELKISTDSLGDLDHGSARVAIDRAISEAVSDLDDRGHEDGKPRQVVITLELKKIDNGMVSAHVETQVKMPRMRTAGTIGLIKGGPKGSQVSFQGYAPEDPRQRTLDEAEVSGGE